MWIEHIAAIVHLVSHPKSVPELSARYSFNRVASFSCTKSIPSGRLGWISHHYRSPVAAVGAAMARTPHAGMVRECATDSTNDALHLEHGKLWTKRCRGLCQLPFILVRCSCCHCCFDPSLMSRWLSLRVGLKLFWWPIEDLRFFGLGHCNECWCCILRGPMIRENKEDNWEIQACIVLYVTQWTNQYYRELNAARSKNEACK